MPQGLLLSVRFHEGRYHGQPEWPPSPARLFQALLAGASSGKTVLAEDRHALLWLEQLPAPIIATPAIRTARTFRNYVPNNDLDAVGGDPGRIGEIRAPKVIKARLFDAQVLLLYAWYFDQGEQYAKRICHIAERVYQLGRGSDMAWAWGEIISGSEIEARLVQSRGALHRPGEHGETLTLLCPERGSLQSLEKRFTEGGSRFTSTKLDRQVRSLFTQASKALFRPVPYDSPPWQFLFELRHPTQGARFAPWPLTDVAKLVECLRDQAANKLTQALPEKRAIIERSLIGRASKEADKAARIRIVPLPSIGSVHVVHSIRRVLVEVPSNCPLSPEDVAWAFSGIEIIDQDTGEVKYILVVGDETEMLRHFAIGTGNRERYRSWHTVTPAALPEQVARRRIDPQKLRSELQRARTNASTQLIEAKSSPERISEEDRAAASVFHALRHAEIPTKPETIRVQREPFEAKGSRAEAFAKGTRFAKERLWHIEIDFGDPVKGPLIIGDGRYLGLGLMAPVQDTWRDGIMFTLPKLPAISVSESPALLYAIRRALMAISRDITGGVARLFSGHERNGKPAASGRHEHCFLAADDRDGDGHIDRVFVAAPWLCDRSIRSNHKDRITFDRVVSRLESVRAGRLGVLGLSRPASVVEGDPLIGPARVWKSKTAYWTTRHAGRRQDRVMAIAKDVVMECMRRRLPRPEVEILEYSALANGGGLSARARIRFATAVRGPLLLGRDSHRGGGLFVVSNH